MLLDQRLLQALREAHESLDEDSVSLEEAVVPIGAVKLRRGLWWRKTSPQKWKMISRQRTPGIEVAKHKEHQPVKQRWQKRQGL